MSSFKKFDHLKYIIIKLTLQINAKLFQKMYYKPIQMLAQKYIMQLEMSWKQSPYK